MKEASPSLFVNADVRLHIVRMFEACSTERHEDDIDYVVYAMLQMADHIDQIEQYRADEVPCALRPWAISSRADLNKGRKHVLDVKP